MRSGRTETMAGMSHLIQPSSKKDYPYFRRVWYVIIFVLLAAALVPLILMGGIMYHYADTALKDIGIYVLMLGTILIVSTVFMTTHYVVSRLETQRRHILSLDRQLGRTNQMALSMELSLGVFDEIKDRISNIDTVVMWVEESLQSDATAAIRESLQQVRKETSKCRQSIDPILRLCRPAEDIVAEVNIKTLLEDLLRLTHREFSRKGITTHSEFQADLPLIMCNPSHLHRIFLSLILNAVNTVEDNGIIILSTRLEKGRLMVVVTEEGTGISSSDSQPAPSWDAPGLEFSICADILDKIGGSIDAGKAPGKRVFYRVYLPLG